MRGKWLVSNSGKYIAQLINHDNYDMEWCVRVYRAKFRPGVVVSYGGDYDDGFPYENLLEEPLLVWREIYWRDRALEIVFNAFEELENEEQKKEN